MIGSCSFNPLDLELRKPQKLSIKNAQSKKIAEISLMLIEQFKKYSFTDYLDAGLEFKVICNIDFTASNKKPNENDSLHRMGAGSSAYE